MKKLIFILLLLPSLSFGQGFATLKKGGDTVIVSTPDQLKSAIALKKPAVILVKGEIKGIGIYYTSSNKAVIGSKGAAITGITLGISSVENFLVQNIIFRYQVSDPGILIKYQSKNIVVDHCEFYQDRLHGWDYWGKHISITRGSDMVTVSWCKFHDANLSVLIGGGVDSSNTKDDFGKLHVTMHHNYFYNISEREPSIMTGSLHMYNNLHVDNGGYSIGARNGAQVRIDGDVFINCKVPVTTVFNGETPGYIGDYGSVYINSGKNQINTPNFLWAAPYKFTLSDTKNIRLYLPKIAGVR